MKLRLITAAFIASVAACSPAPEWSPAGDKIMTTWGENLDPSDVHTEYPRPQMVRDEWVNLNAETETSSKERHGVTQVHHILCIDVTVVVHIHITGITRLEFVSH